MALFDGLLHRWTCNQLAGNLLDSIASLNMIGTTASAPTPGFQVPGQGAGRLAEPDGAILGTIYTGGATKDAFAYVLDMANVRFAASTAKTIGFWFKPVDDGAGNANDHYLVADENVTWFGSPSFEGAWGFRWDFSSGHYHVNFEYITGSSGGVANSETLTIDMGSSGFLNVWHTAIVTYDGTTFSFYMDCGSPVTDSTPPNPYITAGRDPYLTIGGRWLNNPTANSHGNGASAYLDEVCIWDHVLSAQDRSDFCAGVLPIPTAGFLVYFAGLRDQDNLSAMDYGNPTVLTVVSPEVGLEYILTAPAADLAGFASGRMGNVKLRRAGTSSDYTGSIIVRGMELFYVESES